MENEKLFEINEEVSKYAIKEFEYAIKRIHSMFSFVASNAWDFYGNEGQAPKEYIEIADKHYVQTAKMIKRNLVDYVIWLEKTYGKGAEAYIDTTPTI